MNESDTCPDKESFVNKDAAAAVVSASLPLSARPNVLGMITMRATAKTNMSTPNAAQPSPNPDSQPNESGPRVTLPVVLKIRPWQ